MTQPPDDSSAFTAFGDTPIGRAGEHRAIGITRDLLAARGYAIEQRPSSDPDGEDARLSVDGIEYTLQATTIPHAPDFWRDVKRERSAVTSVTPQQAAAWLQQGIAKKVDSMADIQRASTIVVLDAHDWGAELANKDIVTHLEDASLNPAQRYGLAGLAIAGEAVSDSTWLSGTLR